eukprot:PITA_27312
MDDSVDIYMDDFTAYGDSFEEALGKFEKVLERCKQAHVSLSTEKCHMMMNEGIFLGHLLSATRIRMDPAKIKVIHHFPIPRTPTQQVDKLPYAVYYVSKNLAPAKLNYTVSEKEFLVVIYAISKFRHYIIGYPTFVHTDHGAIRYLMNKPVTLGHIRRWLLLLKEFDITIVDKPGKGNMVVDFLSRLENNVKGTPIEDSFPDEYLFAISTNTP